MGETVINIEEYPLQNLSQYQKRSRSYKGPLRALRLCLLGIALPTALVSVPLYLRYHVYANQLYPFAVSDMRLIDRRISTVWCQKQVIKVNNNATFNAFLLSNQPNISSTQKSVSMVRDILLEDDMKEYWGFYLLAGSKVTVSTCVRWPGASLIVIRGHKHLHECAYIGDDSSEELDEMLESVKDGIYINDSSESNANEPNLMKRHRPDIRFHHPLHENGTLNHSLDHDSLESNDITDPKLLKTLLDTLSKKTEKMNRQRQQLLEKFNKQVPLQYAEVQEITTTTPKDIQNSEEHMTSSEELYKEIAKKLDALGDRQHSVLNKLNNRISEKVENTSNSIENFKDRNKRQIFLKNRLVTNLNADDEKANAAIEEAFNPDGIADHRGFINETTLNDQSNSEFWSSFSSSEEALLNCNGLILNLPLTPHSKCEMNQGEDQLNHAALPNTVTYLVPSDGYYFFVFNSENEVQVNYVRVRFNLNKTVYDVSHPISSCSNSTSCSLDLRFLSDDTTVMEFPVSTNESRWNEEVIVESECQPRTILYTLCVLAVPVFIILFAFQ